MNESVVEFKRELLKKSVAELCKRAGWESITSRVVEVLVEIMEKYILKLSVTTKAFSELYNRQKPNTTDVWLSYKQNGVDLSDLYEYLENIEDHLVASEVPVFPAPRSCLQNKEKSSRHKTNKHKLENSSNALVTLERKASTADMQIELQREKPTKAKASNYQMRSLMSVDSRIVDTGVSSTAASASRRQLPQRNSFSNFSFTNSFLSHQKDSFNYEFKNQNDSNINARIYNNEFKKDYSDEEREDYHLNSNNGINKPGLHPRENGRKLKKYNEDRNSKNKFNLQHSTPTAKLIANFKKTRKATIKEAFISKKRLLNRSPPTSNIFQKSLVAKSHKKRYMPPQDQYLDQPIKKKPGRKPKKRNLLKIDKNNYNNAYNVCEDGYNVSNVQTTEPLNTTIQHDAVPGKDNNYEDSWTPQKVNDSKNDIYVKETDNEGILPWTDAENSPDKNQNFTFNNEASFVSDKNSTSYDKYDMPESVLNIDKNSLTDVSKATGLELILGNKQESNTEIFHSQSFDNDIIAKKKVKKKSKKQKRELKNTYNEDINDMDNHYKKNIHVDDDNKVNIESIGNNTNDYITNLFSNIKKSNFQDLDVHCKEGVSDAKKEDNLSTLVSVAVDERDKRHDIGVSCLPENTTISESFAGSVDLTDDPYSQKKKKKKKSKKRKNELETSVEDTSKKPKMDDQLSLPKLTLKFRGNTLCGEKPAPQSHSNRPKAPIKLVIKPFTGMRPQSPSHYSGSSRMPSSRSQSPDDLARLAVGQRKPRADIYDSDQSLVKRSPIYSDSPSPPHQYNTPINPCYNTPHAPSQSTPYLSNKKSKSFNFIKSTPVIPPSQKVSKQFKNSSIKGKNKKSEKAGKITQANGEVIWICPTCGFPDNGSPMIGCDKCDDWYHWVCVNITEEPPEEVSWFCSFCVSQASSFKNSTKRGRPSTRK